MSRALPAPLAHLLCLALLLGACAGPAERPNDERGQRGFAVEAAVKQALRGELGIAATAIGVRSKGSRVTLTGFVETADQRRRAVATASGVPGVTRVNDRLETK